MQQRHVNNVVVSETWHDQCQRIAWPLDSTPETICEYSKHNEGGQHGSPFVLVPPPGQEDAGSERRTGAEDRMREGGDSTTGQGYREVMLTLVRALSYWRSSVASKPCEDVPFEMNIATWQAVALVPLSTAVLPYHMLSGTEVLSIAQRIIHINCRGYCPRQLTRDCPCAGP